MLTVCSVAHPLLDFSKKKKKKREEDVYLFQMTDKNVNTLSRSATTRARAFLCAASTL